MIKDPYKAHCTEAGIPLKVENSHIRCVTLSGTLKTVTIWVYLCVVAFPLQVILEGLPGQTIPNLSNFSGDSIILMLQNEVSLDSVEYLFQIFCTSALVIVVVFLFLMGPVQILQCLTILRLCF